MVNGPIAVPGCRMIEIGPSILDDSAGNSVDETATGCRASAPFELLDVWV